MNTKTLYGVSANSSIDFGYEPVIELIELHQGSMLYSVEVVDTVINLYGKGMIKCIETQRGRYYFNEGTGNYFYDHSGRGNHIPVGCTPRTEVTINVD